MVKQIHVLHISFDMQVLALYYFVVSCCVTVLGQKVLCSVVIFQTFQRLNVLSLGCVPHFQLWKSVHVPSVCFMWPLKAAVHISEHTLLKHGI